MALYGVAMSLVEALLFLQMAREFGSSKRLMGAVTLVGTTTELPIFHRSDALVARFGHARLLRAAHGCMVLRLCALACVTPAAAPWALPLLQLLHGPCRARVVRRRELRGGRDAAAAAGHVAVGALDGLLRPRRRGRQRPLVLRLQYLGARRRTRPARPSSRRRPARSSPGSRATPRARRTRATR